MLGKYELEDEIGHGGMATVYRARDTVLDRRVAVKLLHPHLRAANEAKVRFAREARSVARLKHPNILEIHDSSTEDAEEAYLVVELLTGPTLRDFVAGCDEVPAEVVAAIGIQLASALALAHAKGIIHRDVKPENVLLHENRCVKLTDFGIAQMVDVAGFTQTGQILGSPGHMAPEQIEGKDSDERSDVFGLGTVLYYVACGRLPFVGKNPHQLLHRVMQGEFPDPLRLRPAVGERLRAILLRCLAGDRDARFQSASALEDALRSYLSDVGVGDPDTLLRDYLTDPVTTTARIRGAAIAYENRAGIEAAGRGDVLVAQAHFGRVLALDPGNVDALARLSKLGRSLDRRRRAWRAFGIAVAIAGALSLAIALRGPSGPRTDATGESARVMSGSAPPVSSRSASPTSGAASPTTRAVEGSSSTSSSRVVGDPNAAATRETSEPRGDRPGTREAAANGDRGAAASAGSDRRHLAGSRAVVFRPTPQNVEIAIDDGPLRAFGPSFTGALLETGRHRLRIVPGTDCCEPLETTFVVEAGTEPQVVSRALALRPARLYVIADVPADVVVTVEGRAPIRGRARELLRVPMESTEADARISVTARGYRDYTGRVLLRIGQVAEERVTLVPEAPRP